MDMEGIARVASIRFVEKIKFSHGIHSSYVTTFEEDSSVLHQL